MNQTSFGIHVTNYGLKMDINPLVNHFKLSGNYVIQHWQAKPFGFRHFGYFVIRLNQGVQSSKYYTILWNKCKIELHPETLQVDETLYPGKVPIAVNYFPRAMLVPNTNLHILNKRTHDPYTWLLTHHK